MPGRQDPGPSVKDKDTYEALREKGYSKEKSARIANAQANPHMHPSEKGGHARPYEEWTKEELKLKAREVDIPKRSGMRKRELIEALRRH